MSAISIPRIGRGAGRVILVLPVAVARLSGNALAAHASDGSGVTSSSPQTGQFWQTALTPDRLYGATGTSPNNLAAVVSSVSAGPTLGAALPLLPGRASSLFASAGRAIAVDTGGHAVLLDRAAQVASIPMRGTLTSFSGSWYTVRDEVTSQPWMVSLDGASINLGQYEFDRNTATNARY